MFSIGWGELLVVGLVSVLVLKPEQMVSLARTIRRFIQQCRSVQARIASDVAELEKEADLKKRIEKASRVSDVSDLISHE